MNCKVLVTGADGFVGNFVCNILDDFERYCIEEIQNCDPLNRLKFYLKKLFKK